MPFYSGSFTNANCLRPFIQAAIFLFKQVLNLSPTANKGIAASRAGRCYLWLRLAISFSSCRTSVFGLLFIIFYFYSFSLQRLGPDIAMNPLPASNTLSLCASLNKSRNHWKYFSHEKNLITSTLANFFTDINKSLDTAKSL